MNGEKALPLENIKIRQICDVTTRLLWDLIGTL